MGINGKPRRDCPVVLENGVRVACRICKRCLVQRAEEWRGRLTAELSQCYECVFVTLTYGPDPATGDKHHYRSLFYVYRDVQKFIRKQRDAGERFRYFVCGEKGSLKNRTHYHLLIFYEKPFDTTFWNAKLNKEPTSRGRRASIPLRALPRFNSAQKAQNLMLPESKRLPDNERINSDLWPHGFMQIKTLDRYDPFPIFYVTKYMVKDYNHADPNRPSKPNAAKYWMSKKPLIGAGYILMLANEYVKQGLPVNRLTYSPPNSERPNMRGSVRDFHRAIAQGYNGRPVVTQTKRSEFVLRRAAAKLFVTEYVTKWREVNGDDPHITEAIDNWVASIFYPRNIDYFEPNRGTPTESNKPFVPPLDWLCGYEDGFGFYARKPVYSHDEGAEKWSYKVKYVPIPQECGREVRWSPSHRAYYVLRDADSVKVFYTFDRHGDRCWSPVLVSRLEAERLKTSLSSLQYRSEYLRRSGSAGDGSGVATDSERGALRLKLGGSFTAPVGGDVMASGVGFDPPTPYGVAANSDGGDTSGGAVVSGLNLKPRRNIG